MLLLAAAVLGCARARPRPNLILVSLDTLRADHLGLYGHVRETSPRLDALAHDAVVFDRAVAQAPNTPPSQATMMTSLYPGTHGFTGNRDRLPREHPTLAELLQEAGYATAGFVDGGYLSHVFGFDRGFETYDDKGGGLARTLPKARAWLAERGERPFFLFLHSYDVHAPYLPPPPFFDHFHTEPYAGDFVPTAENMQLAFSGAVQLSPQDRRHVVLRYDEGVRYADEQIGSFLAELEAKGWLRDTLLIVTSDHGEEFGEHGSYLHWQLFYQPILRIPLIVRLPGGAGGGRRIGRLVELVDLLPTVLDLLELPPLENAQGRSLGPLLREEPGATQEDGWARPAPAWPPEPAKMDVRSLIVGGYQLRFHMNDGAGAERVELYDLRSDPMALRELSEEQPELARALRTAAAEIFSSTKNGSSRTIEIDEEVRGQLQALGYVP